MLHDLLEHVEVEHVRNLSDLAPLLLHATNLLQVQEDIANLLQLSLVRRLGLLQQHVERLLRHDSVVALEGHRR